MKKFCMFFVFLATLSLTFLSCSQEPPTNVVDVTAKDYYFHVSDSLKSGWTTFRFHNKGMAHHFFLLTLLPDSIKFNRYLEDVAPAFGSTWDSIRAGMSKSDAAALLGSRIPSWYASSKVMGGVGLIAPGKTTETTLRLEPGNYVMECYVKTKEGVFHGALGMIRPLTVLNEDSGMKEPDNANVELFLTNYKIESKGKLSPGKNRVAVHFKEQPEYGLGNDVHLVRLTDSTDLDKVIKWMDWMNINGLRSPAPAEFLGGTQEMPVGYTSYFTVNLESGKYAWISESGADKGMVKEFTVE